MRQFSDIGQCVAYSSSYYLIQYLSMYRKVPLTIFDCSRSDEGHLIS